ncbi:Isocitrate dehydrogenase [NADP] 2 [Sinobacterium norvegicum]|uniref:Isocitrate dehydrogenase [NADP] n=1 Tax=Sinobacterium norvegicum TaxID=1641715 RepID=A0ABM9ADM3_9GAMM|nr:NADP-dependent isocitrate dehydrogenase [Sinobacterium norvegicum]CAH0991311.1 Isocitrate dehydrogenase [NADP] 2 [Sinobacterium norvegicum]
MSKEKSKIIYTLTDEAPALATYSLLPIVNTFTAAAGIEVATTDLSLAGRILANFPDNLSADQRVADGLKALGELTQDPKANIIKLPNVSASIPQLIAAITELQGQGYDIPDYPAEINNEADNEIKNRYAKVLGSAVNPVLREGNSDRRAPGAVKQYARENPHSMGKWSQASRTHVAHMRSGDFKASDISTTVTKAGTVNIELVEADGKVTLLKQVPVEAAEIISAQYMSTKALCKFLDEEMDGANKADLLFSLHLKATMMKVSDPIVFGHAVSVYFKDAFEKHAETLTELGIQPNDGLGSVLRKIDSLPYSQRAEIEYDLRRCYEDRPEMAMVDSDKGITNLHVPSDIIVDASMPAMIRNGGKMWSADGKLKDTKAVIPDSCYATIYQEVINFCKHHDHFDPTTMGTVPNVGLMAQKAEEYGSHDKTFELPASGTVRVVADDGEVLLQHDGVEAGDVWRMFQAKDAPIRDWVKLAVTRARAMDVPALFWLDEHRGHDAEMIKKVELYLQDHDTEGLKIHILNPDRAIRYTMERLLRGLDTISVTGNVLRDYLTDLFPILELGTSAKMLSIVPLMQGGGLFETGAGGSAPKHVQQFEEENHLRWDSLGEFLAIAVSLEDIAVKNSNPKAQILADTLDQATGQLLSNGKSPSRKVKQLDNRGSHFYLALYWAQALAAQTDDAELQAAFSQLAKDLADNEQQVSEELIACQGQPVEMGGYYMPTPAKLERAMRPSETLNKLLNNAL